MPAALIKDFLLTQGLKLPLDEVRAAYLTAQTVMDMGTASIDRRFCGAVMRVGNLPITCRATMSAKMH